jgi:cbb3-type cytochrome oxidase subunit 3
MQERFRIWFAFLGGALGWTLHLMGTYALSEGFCRSGLHTFSFLGFSLMLWGLMFLTLLALAVTVCALWLSRRHHLASLASIRVEQRDISLFMARSSLLGNALFLLIIIAQAFPILILGGTCS